MHMSREHYFCGGCTVISNGPSATRNSYHHKTYL